MANPPQYPLLRLDPPVRGGRKTRKPGFAPSRKFEPSDQRGRPPGQALGRLARLLAEGRDPLELRADPGGLAPERWLVFELTGDVQNFARAAANVPGLEFIAAEDIEADEIDKSPSIYLMVPDTAAFQQVVNLWNRFQASEALPEGLTPWRDLFAQLRDVRPWGPQDRLSPEDLEVLAQEHANEQGMVRVELELVFRAPASNVERDALEALRASGGELVARTRIDGAKYHALLVEIPLVEIQRVLARGQAGLVASESVMHIRPQSSLHITVIEPQPGAERVAPPPPQGDPV